MPEAMWRLGPDRRSAVTDRDVDVDGTFTARDAQINGTFAARDARIKGDLNVAGRITGSAIVGKVHYSQITGLLGDGFSLQLPDVADNVALVETNWPGPDASMVIVTGPGYDIERLPGFHANGTPFDQPGFAMAHPFIFEGSGSNADALRASFDQYLANPAAGGQSLSLIVKDLAKKEVFRWNFLEYIPDSHEPSIDGRTRFRWKPVPNPTHPFCIVVEPGDPFGDNASYNPATDNMVEISGVGSGLAPQVVVDEANRTLTMTFGIAEGHGILGWVKDTIEGIADKKSLSVSTHKNGAWVSGRNYFGCFPMKYEQFSGFGLAQKIKARVILSYDHDEEMV